MYPQLAIQQKKQAKKPLTQKKVPGLRCNTNLSNPAKMYPQLAIQQKITRVRNP